MTSSELLQTGRLDRAAGVVALDIRPVYARSRMKDRLPIDHPSYAEQP